LPSDALPVANSLSSTTPTSFGASSGSNNNNMLYASVDAKGRITSIGHRNLVTADLPDTLVTPGTYGDGSTVLTQITVDSKGRITGAQESSISASNITSVNASTVSGALTSDNLPSGVVTAGVTSIPNSITVDTYGRVTSVSGGSITASNVSNFNSAVQANRLDQLAAPTADVSFNSRKITNLDTPSATGDAATKGYVDTNFTKTVDLNTPIDNRLQTNSVYLSATGILNAGGKPITNVGTTTNANDVVTKSYLEANAIYATGTNLSAGNKYLTDLIMRPSGSLSANDAVNFGYIETAILNAGGQQLVGTSAPQVFKQTWASANAISNNTPATTSYIRYQFNFVDPTNVLYATSALMMLVEGTGGTRIFTPNLANATASGANAVYDGYFWLDTSGGTTKVLNVYVSSTPTGDITIRNFGLSRIVAGGTATTSSTGLVSIASGNDGGISVSGAGAIAIIPATASQLGGLKLGTGLSAGTGGTVNVAFPIANNNTLGQVFVPAVATSGLNLNSTTGALSLSTASSTQLGGVRIDDTAGLTNTSGLISVTRSDSTSSSSTSTLANSKAVNDLRGLTVLRDGTQAMSGKLTAFASTTSSASLNLPSGVAPNSPVIGDVWNQSGTLKLRTDGTTTKDIAFTDSSISGNAATATKLAATKNITLSGAVTSSATAFDGSSNITISTTLATGQAVTSLASSDMTVSAATGSVTLTLPQSITTSSSVTFTKATLGNIRISNTGNQIDTSSGNLTLDSTGGTTTINDNTSISGSLTVTGTNTTSLGGAVTLGDSLALSAAAGKIALGDTAAAAKTSIERIGTAGSVVAVGDMVLRVPASRKAYLVSNDTNTTAATANDVIITETALASRISGLGSTYMPNAGALNSAGSQTFGSSASSGAVFIQTGTSPATQVTVAANGSVTLEKALTVVTGGATITAGGLTVGTSGTTSTATVYGPLVVNGTISGVSTPTASNHAATKGYVDTYNDSVSTASVYTSVRKAYLANPVSAYKVLSLQTSSITVNSSNMTVGVPEYWPMQTTGTASATLNVAAGHKVILLHKYSNSDPVTGFVLTTATVSSLLPEITTLTEILAKKGSPNTYTTLSLGTVWDGGATGTAITLGSGNTSTKIHDFVLMRIA
jgi:hypothetical protein